LFNGTQLGWQNFVDCVLAQAKTRGKATQSLPKAGFEKATLGRLCVMIDCGKTPAQPLERHTHAAPLAFELCYGKDRIFVSCGTHPFCGEWREALRATAAHNCVVLNNRNACEIREDGFFARRVQKVSVHREDTKYAVLLDASHDGYMALNGVTHRRRLFLSQGGNDFRGEDCLSAGLAPQAPIDYAVRFHLHPKVMVSLVRDGTEALLRLGGGGPGWQFFHSGGVLALENSIYLGAGSRPRKTKQLVLYGRMAEASTQIKWGLKRTG